MDIKSKLSRVITPSLLWTGIRSFGNSTPARLTIFIPLLGYLIIFNENAAQYFELSKELLGNKPTNTPAAPISLRLLSIYFGLCTIALASVIYAVFCPKEVKRHGSAEEYVGGDAQNLSGAQLRALARDLNGKDRREKEFIDFTIQLQSISGQAAANYRRANEETEVEGTRIYFEMKNDSWPAARWACTIFYAIGLIILAVPSAEVFFRALALLLNRFS